MSLDLSCDICDKPLDRPGALVFSPPDAHGNTKKRHVCVPCWQKGPRIENIVAAVQEEPEPVTSVCRRCVSTITQHPVTSAWHRDSDGTLACDGSGLSPLLQPDHAPVEPEPQLHCLYCGNKVLSMNAHCPSPERGWLGHFVELPSGDQIGEDPPPAITQANYVEEPDAVFPLVPGAEPEVSQLVCQDCDKPLTWDGYELLGTDGSIGCLARIGYPPSSGGHHLPV